MASVFLFSFKMQYSSILAAESIETGHVTKHSQTCARTQAHTYTHTHATRLTDVDETCEEKEACVQPDAPVTAATRQKSLH